MTQCLSRITRGLPRLLLVIFFPVILIPAANGQTLSGRITDADGGLPMAGATVSVVDASGGQVAGSATDLEGLYSMNLGTTGLFTVYARFVGYQEIVQPISVSANQTITLNIEMSQTGFELNTVIVTSSRRQEKALDAPASISVLNTDEVARDVGSSSVDALRNTTGVDMAQTGVDRREMVLRGFNNAFSGAAYVLTDYRQSAVASLNVNLYSIMPNMNIDIDRIEVVRGPGSALYGPGVDAGVVHFITKDPFTHPGTTISLQGGERSLFGGQFRHAQVLGAENNIGIKVTGMYSQADDWEMDPNDATDVAQMANDKSPRQTDFEKLNFNGSVEYRFGEGAALIASGGFAQLTTTVLSGIGTLQAVDFGYTYGQLRFQMDRFFAQAYVNMNDAGGSFVYANDLDLDGKSDAVVDDGAQYVGQAQYDLSLGDGKHEIIIGTDIEITRPDTKGTILGRNESNDDISEYGVYAQSTSALAPKLDLVIALRGDYDNIYEKFQMSPRAGLVFKPSTVQSFRVTYNRAISAPSTNSLFLDIPGQTNNFPGGLNFIMQGRGAADGFSFDSFRSSNTARFFLPVPGAFGMDIPLQGMPLQAIYGAGIAGFGATLRSGDPLPPPFSGLAQAQRDALAALLEGFTPFVSGATTGVLGIPDDSETGYEVVSGPVDVSPLRQTTTQTVEVGFKGLFGNKFLFTVDGYYTQKKDFVGPLLVTSPLVYIPTLAADLAPVLTQVIQGAALQNPQIGGFLGSLGLNEAAAAGLVSQFLSLGFNAPGDPTPVAVVQPDASNPALASDNGGKSVGGFLTYRNFGNVDFFGLDASFEYQASPRFSVFGNVSLVSDDFFDNVELDEADKSTVLALNAPKMKLKGGVRFNTESGFSFSASGRYNDAFEIRSGPYVGLLEDYFQVDAGVGYDMNRFAQGVQIDIGVTNVLDDDHREFIGAPNLGRLGIARITYNIR